MHFDGSFVVPGNPKEVIVRFADVNRMALCMPGARITGQEPDGSYAGEMTVSFGPKRFVIRGKVTCKTDPASLSGSLHGRGVADARAARVAVSIAYSLSEAALPGAAVATRIDLTANADLQGVLAEFGRTGGTVVAEALMLEFSRRLGDELRTENAISSEFGKGQPSNAPKALSIMHLLRVILSRKFVFLPNFLKRLRG